MTTFEKANTNVNFPNMEEDILSLWDKLDAFHESNRRREDQGDFVFYDGPPFATGTPHYGHLLAGTIKDIVPRFWNMRGKKVERRFGWDCHGLPIEALAQDALGLAGTAAIQETGVGVFNEQCRSMVQTYVGEWKKTVTRMGRWVDFENDYKTMDPNFMETVWWVFKQLWDKDRVYQAHRIMPYSWKLTTPLSNFEANSNYKDVQDPAITIKLKLKENSVFDDEVFALAWTTTPWTLPSNLALCVNTELDYVVIKDNETNENYLLAESRVSSLYKKEKMYSVLKTLKGSELTGLNYEPLFPYFKDNLNSFVILEDGYVSDDSGTGIVHIAPGYGEDDYRISTAANIEMVDPLNDEANFTAATPEYEGQFCKDADKAIIRRLKEEGKLLRQSTITHSYPFCERTETPLIYRAIKAWYVKVEDMRDSLIRENDKINWVPEHVGKGRFGNWLADARDWNISRNRFWGSCIPIWIADDGDMICIGSKAELEELSGQKVDDLHKHILDDILIEKNGKTYKRTPEVLDCWFESGSMPFAQQHFPFEEEGIGSLDSLEKFFPANFIAEGLDQTRGWFYTLLILSTTIFGKSCYENVVVNGMILAEDGEKMSKRKKNYPDPTKVLDAYGADALRAYLINSPVVRGEPLKFSEAGLKDILRTVVLPYWNAYSFFTTYASVDNYDPRTWEAPSLEDRPDIDKWILSVMQSLISDVVKEMENYRLYSVVPKLTTFIDDLTNWYIRSSRRRFWKSESDTDKKSAFATLYEVLTTFAKLLAPFMPFLTEEVYQGLVCKVDSDAPESVHWCDYPVADENAIDVSLETRMKVIRAAVSLGRKIREDKKIKVRQPLQKVTIVHRDDDILKAVQDGCSSLCLELNVKAVEAENDESKHCELVVKPNFKALSKRCGPKLGKIGGVLKSWGFEEVSRLESGETIEVEGEVLALEDVFLQRKTKGDAAIATDGFITVVLETELTDELVKEGIARELVSSLQNLRKETGLEITDRVKLEWNSLDEVVSKTIEQNKEYIMSEILAKEIIQNTNLEMTEKINDLSVGFSIVKA